MLHEFDEQVDGGMNWALRAVEYGDVVVKDGRGWLRTLHGSLAFEPQPAAPATEPPPPAMPASYAGEAEATPPPPPPQAPKPVNNRHAVWLAVVAPKSPSQVSAEVGFDAAAVLSQLKARGFVESPARGLYVRSMDRPYVPCAPSTRVRDGDQDAAVLTYVSAHPGCRSMDVAHGLGRDRTRAVERLKHLAWSGKVKLVHNRWWSSCAEPSPNGMAGRVLRALRSLGPGLYTAGEVRVSGLTGTMVSQALSNLHGRGQVARLALGGSGSGSRYSYAVRAGKPLSQARCPNCYSEWVEWSRPDVGIIGTAWCQRSARVTRDILDDAPYCHTKALIALDEHDQVVVVGTEPDNDFVEAPNQGSAVAAEGAPERPPAPMPGSPVDARCAPCAAAPSPAALPSGPPVQVLVVGGVIAVDVAGELLDMRASTSVCRLVELLTGKAPVERVAAGA